MALGFRPGGRLTAEDEVGSYIDGLKVMTDEDLGAILAVMTVLRVNMEDGGHLKKGWFTGKKLPASAELVKFQVELVKLTRHFNRMGQPTDAVATVAILNTFRCRTQPEFRKLGRAMWVEFRRGMPYVEAALRAGEEKLGDPFPKRVWREWSEIPAGLEQAE